jgi:Putative auto-transporter adhesin, head GIN domain/Prokaryotic membrane lipoprotein lipid attachment site
MKKTIFALLPVLVLAGCNTGGLRGNGNVVTEQRNVAPFSNVKVEGAFQVEWRNGPPSASIATDENLMQYIEIQSTGNTLHVRTQRSVRPTHSIKLMLASASLESASFSGASQFIAHQLNAARFAFETAGASKVTLDGSVGELTASMTGASDLRAESLQTKGAELSLTGASDARVTVSDSLKVSITGAGKVEYGGNPAVVERHITGAGTIRKRD